MSLKLKIFLLKIVTFTRSIENYTKIPKIVASPDSCAFSVGSPFSCLNLQCNPNNHGSRQADTPVLHPVQIWNFCHATMRQGETFFLTRINTEEAPISLFRIRARFRVEQLETALFCLENEVGNQHICWVPA